MPHVSDALLTFNVLIVSVLIVNELISVLMGCFFIFQLAGAMRKCLTVISTRSDKLMGLVC